MAKEYKYKTLGEFYPYYLTEHQDPISRTLHFIGTGGFIFICIFAILTQNWWLLLLGPVCGYGFAWVGHFVFEKTNRPPLFIRLLVWLQILSCFIISLHFRLAKN
jgi:hypothetical protein